VGYKMKFWLMKLSILFSLIVFNVHVNAVHDAIDESGDIAVETLPFDELRTFTEIFAKIKNNYVEGVKDRKLLENAVQGMLEGLDPHSAYLDKKAYLDLQEGTSGEFGGLGMEVSMENGFVKVISPIDDTPADKAGVKAGDLIIRLDDASIRGMPLNESINLMRGKPGSSITLTVVRKNGGKKPFKIVVVRDIIKVRSVRNMALEPGYGYLRISNFQVNTPENVRKDLEKLKKESNSSLKGLVLDLRNNPGGILSAAVSVSDFFLEEGLIVYMEGRVNDSKLEFSAKPTDLIDEVPIIVLVNAGSASASEIVAGALQDHKRAIIMGQQTFGKGSVQTILPMPNESALKLTTARYYTPSGRSIQALGITPDIIVEELKVEESGDESTSIKEVNLNGYLKNEKQETPAEANDTLGNQPGEIKSLAITDYVLYEALNVLKGISILQFNSG